MIAGGDGSTSVAIKGMMMTAPMITVRNGKSGGSVSRSWTVCRKLRTAGSTGSLRAGTVSFRFSNCPREFNDGSCEKLAGRS